jgi:Tol biopolymer transport system component
MPLAAGQTLSHYRILAPLGAGAQVLYAHDRSGGAADIWIVDLADGQRRELVSTPFHELSPTLSPDGRLLAYFSDESGRLELYLQSLADARTRLRVSTDGASAPRWRADGQRFLAIVTDPEEARRPDEVVVGWERLLASERGRERDRAGAPGRG